MRAVHLLPALVLALSLANHADCADRTVAQDMVERMLASDPSLTALTLHVTLPGRADNIIVASNIAPIGKKADDDDLKLIATGKPEMGPNKAMNRYGVAIRLMTASSKVIGSVNFGFRWKPGDDTAGFLAKAETLRDELAAKIPDADSLVRPAP